MSCLCFCFAEGQCSRVCLCLLYLDMIGGLGICLFSVIVVFLPRHIEGVI